MNKTMYEKSADNESSLPYNKLDDSGAIADLDHKDLPPGSRRNSSYHHSGEESNSEEIISVMGDVEADEIVSTAEALGHRNENSPSREDKTHQQIPSNRPQPVRMLSKRLILVNVLANFLVFTIAGFITYHCFNKATVLFSWHPSLMSAGYIIFMSQAVMTLSGGNFLTYKRHYKTRIVIHWLLQAIAGTLITIAFVCIVLNKIRMGKAHFQTLHAIVGLITFVLTIISIAGGVFTKYGFQLRHIMRPIYSKIMHGIAGTVTYVMGMVTIGLGVYSAWFQEDNNERVRLSLLIGIFAVTLYVIINPVVATISRAKTAVRTTL
ncbi:uncharacterized protein LOC129768618 [Toxorhynchites rutilus septentrionalis]|uniref:uncharacterized protein LOC129768618 n=1 Tax=Toxorhynchites rutilus septentrionalis TaxID=329112 RepID=UPI0024796C04|nr:uncharacterized protein LOC129768618 [Toxorhynchites rutilus septentrionalis]